MDLIISISNSLSQKNLTFFRCIVHQNNLVEQCGGSPFEDGGESPEECGLPLVPEGYHNGHRNSCWNGELQLLYLAPERQMMYSIRIKVFSTLTSLIPPNMFIETTVEIKQFY